MAEPPVIDEAAGRGTVTSSIHETPKVKIKDIIFVNATPAAKAIAQGDQNAAALDVFLADRFGRVEGG